MSSMKSAKQMSPNRAYKRPCVLSVQSGEWSGRTCSRDLHEGGEGTRQSSTTGASATRIWLHLLKSPLWPRVWLHLFKSPLWPRVWLRLLKNPLWPRVWLRLFKSPLWPRVWLRLLKSPYDPWSGVVNTTHFWRPQYFVKRNIFLTMHCFHWYRSISWIINMNMRIEHCILSISMYYISSWNICLSQASEKLQFCNLKWVCVACVRAPAWWTYSRWRPPAIPPTVGLVHLQYHQQ